MGNINPDTLTDKAGNHIDLDVLAGVYLSTFELMAYLGKCTNYNKADLRPLAKLIDKMEGNNYSAKDARFIRAKIESFDWDFSTPVKKVPRESGKKQPQPDVNLLNGEKILAVVRPSRVALVAWAILAGFVVLGAALSAPQYGIPVAFICMIPLIWEGTRVQSNRAVLTTKRICIRMLVPRKSSADIPLSKINSVTAVGSGHGHKYGVLSVNTSSGAYELKGMKNPGAFRDAAISAIDAHTADNMRRQAEEIAKALRS